MDRLPMSIFSKDNIFNFTRDRNGASAMIFALLLMPIVMIVGGAMDYSNARSQQARLQNVVDSATLAGARAVANEENVNEAVEKYIHSAWPESVDLPKYAVEVKNKNVQVVFAQPLVVKTRMLSMFGWGVMPVTTNAVSTIFMPALDIALVVDNSSSMDGTKIDMLKGEIHAFLDKVWEFNQGIHPHDMVWISFVTYDQGISQSYSLTMNIPYLHKPVDTMKGENNTAMGLGIQEGAKWLHKSERRFPSSDYGTATKDKYQYLILLSDGDEDKIGGVTSAEACPAAIASGIKIISIAFMAHKGGDTERMYACAGKPENVYLADGASQLGHAFDDILRRVKEVRLT